MAQRPELIDHQFLQENYLDAGFSNLLVEVLNLFAQQSNSYLAAIQQALEQHDKASVIEQAHTLSGSAGSVGSSAVSEMAQRIEDCASSGKLEQAALLTTELAELVTLTNQAIATKLESITQPDEDDFFS